jgi:hypothetical protein
MSNIITYNTIIHILYSCTCICICAYCSVAQHSVDDVDGCVVY